MASFTRKAIMDSFMKLVDQRPISKITIKDIVEDWFCKGENARVCE